MGSPTPTLDRWFAVTNNQRQHIERVVQTMSTRDLRELVLCLFEYLDAVERTALLELAGVPLLDR